MLQIASTVLQIASTVHTNCKPVETQPALDHFGSSTLLQSAPSVPSGRQAANMMRRSRAASESASSPHMDAAVSRSSKPPCPLATSVAGLWLRYILPGEPINPPSFGSINRFTRYNPLYSAKAAPSVPIAIQLQAQHSQKAEKVWGEGEEKTKSKYIDKYITK